MRLVARKVRETELKSASNNYRFVLGAFFAASVALVGAQGVGGQIALKPIASFPIPTHQVYDASAQVPRIAPVSKFVSRISENDNFPTWLNQGTKNNLPVGGMLPYTQGSGPRLQFPGPGFTNGWPPDCDMAVGPKHVIAVVNEMMSVYDRVGNQLLQTNLTGDQFFKGLGVKSGQVISDPRIQYDKATDHWFVQIIEVDGLIDTSTHGSFQLVGVSQTGDPTGKWNTYRLNTLIKSGSNDLWLDYPGVGLTTDGYVITGNMFGFTAGFTAGIFVTSKSALINGTAGTITSFTDDGAATIMPARNYDVAAPTMYATSSISTSAVKLYAISAFTSSPTVVSTVVTVPSFISPTRDAIGPDNHSMDGFGDHRMFTCVMRNGHIYGAHNIMSKDGTQLACRWYDFATNGWPVTSSPTIAQSGDISQNGTDCHMPAININKYGNISVLYTRCNATTEAQLAYSAHKKTDPAGSMSLSKVLSNSPANSGQQPGNRWGDYFTVAIDPLNDSAFWGFGELSTSRNLWTTQVNNWTVSDPSQFQHFAPKTATAYQGTLVSGGAASLASIDASSMNVASTPVKQSGQLAGVEAIYSTTLVPGNTDQLTVSAVANLPSKGTQQVYAWDWIAKKYVLCGANPSGNTSDYTVFSSVTDSTRFIASDGTVKILYRSIVPSGISAMPPSYILGVNELVVNGLPS